jgi:Na+-transporting NADH:ubiquinone oxidoreductase subunit NqrC
LVGKTLHLTALAVSLTPSKGYKQQCIGSHSIHASSAMALKLNGINNMMIQKLSHWLGNTFRHYIQPQISNLTHGIATHMTTLLQFTFAG